MMEDESRYLAGPGELAVGHAAAPGWSGKSRTRVGGQRACELARTQAATGGRSERAGGKKPHGSRPVGGRVGRLMLFFKKIANNGGENSRTGCSGRTRQGE